jgi:hypothetical protein
VARDTKIVELTNNAVLAGQASDWAGARRQWLRLWKLTNSDFYLCMAIEASRLDGHISGLKYVRLISFERIFNAMKNQSCGELIALKLSDLNKISFDEYSLLLRNKKHFSDSTYRELIRIVGASPETLSFYQTLTEVKISPIRDIESASLKLLDAKTFSYKSKRSNSLGLMNWFRSNFKVRDWIQLEISAGNFGAGTDVIQINDIFYTDRLDYKNKLICDLRSDSHLVCMRGGAAVIKNWTCDSSYQIEDVLWMGYPGTENFGHFYAECLLRLAVASKGNANFFTRIAILEESNKKFGSFLKSLFPQIEIVELKRNKVYKGKNVRVIPSTFFLPINLNSRFRNQDLAWGDPRASWLLRELCRKALDQNESNSPQFASRIFLNRSTATNRLGNDEGKVEALLNQFGYQSVDPGELSPVEELNLLYFAKSIVGFFGSQLLLSSVARDLDLLIVIDSNSRPDIDLFILNINRNTKMKFDVIGNQSDKRRRYGENSIQRSEKLTPRNFKQLMKILD